MEALRFCPKSKTLSLEKSIEIPKIVNLDDVLIEVAFSGLCGTDIHIVQGEFSFPSEKPLTLGHEFSGVVIATGEGVKNLEKGCRVAINPNNGCNACKVCLEGNYHFCQKGSLRTTIGIGRNGAFAKFCVAPMEQVYRLPDEVSFEQGALCEPLSCILRGWDRLQKVGAPKENSKILVLGAGIIGNLWMCLLHHKGFRNVIVSELSPIRQKLAIQLETGFDIVGPQELKGKMPQTRAEAEQEGIDVIIDCTGSAKALQESLFYVARGATILIFGCAPIGQTMSICPEEIFAKELTIMGTMIDPFTYGRSVALAKNMGSRYLDLKRLGIQVFPLSEYQPAIEKLKRGEVSKIMFEL